MVTSDRELNMILFLICFVLNMELFTKQLLHIHLYLTVLKEMVKRNNRTLKEMMNVMLISSSILQNMWGGGGEALLSTNFASM